MNMTITEISQFTIALISLIVSFFTYKVAKNSLNVSKNALALTKEISDISQRCIIYPVDISFPNGRGCLTFENNGVGLAFNIKVFMYVRDTQDINNDFVKKKASGPRVINPNSKQNYIIEQEGIALSLERETPLSIFWETLSGAKYEAQWVWSQDPYGDVDFSLLEEKKLN
ncbi:hypothetical protein QJ133_00985 [Priestia megaterium]|uniref:hypothetical protein n=1 Tax=Priestia megaterium TaxID=1404 RepID=UPI00249A87DD|nr:hypothetical protein [Priestia megaterium]MDI3089775.1 hypothetical protein [Priestia megaterium]